MQFNKLVHRIPILVVLLLPTLACRTILELKPGLIPTTSETSRVGNYDGGYTGATSQNIAVTLKILHNEVISFSIGANFSKLNCSAEFKFTMETSTISSVPLNPIRDGVFKLTSDDTAGSSIITGTFTSEDTAIGSLTYTSKGNCSGTITVDWTVTKVSK